MFSVVTFPVFVAVAAIVVYYGNRVVMYLDLDKRVYNHVPGECGHLHSPETGASDVEMYDHTLLFPGGSDLRNATNATAGIFYWRLEGRAIEQAQITHVKEPHPFNPHGTSVFMNVLMVASTTDHLADAQADRVDMFMISVKDRRSPVKLRFTKGVTSQYMTGLRDVVAVDKDRFYATNRHMARHPKMRKLEVLLGMRTGSVLYFDGKKVSVAIKDLGMPTGIVYEPRKRQLYVSCFSENSIHVYNANRQTLTKVNEIALSASPYFLSMDPIHTTLLVTLHPQKIRYLMHESDPFSYFAPSQVVEVKRKHTAWSIKQLYANDGATISAATVAFAFYQQDKPAQLFIGNSFGDALTCELTMT